MQFKGRRKQTSPDEWSPKPEPTARKDIDAFYAENPVFQCDKLHARITRGYCAHRQKPRESTRTSYSTKATENFIDAFCRSGDCIQGHETLVMLKRK